ncbi:MAG: PQQ-dependent sugar dehydrogenase [Planctomycetes bacterium]|nr:PQQ-dependent sugar dehydrogenase [Planctomycetota bacterium]
MHFFRRAREVARPTSTTRLRLERLEDREVPTVIAGFTESPFTSGLTQPTAMAVAPDGRVFVAEKGGTLRVVQNGTVLATPFLSVSVDTASERGLIGVALDPNFATNGSVYVYYTTSQASAGKVVNRVSRFAASGNVSTGTETVLLDDIASTNGNHNGGALAFAPDGTLFIGVGEAGVPSNAPDLTTLSGKILRINANGSVPADNPFVGMGNGVRPEIWAYGLRNPFTMAFQPGTGRLFINDVGQSAFEEIDEGVKGANYGWPATEGFTPAGVAGVTYPIYAYAHGTGPLQGNSIAGGAFYNPASPSFPSAFAGDYFFGDFVNSRIFVRDAATGTVNTFSPQTAGGGVVDLDVLPDGRLLYLSLNTGTIYQIAADPNANPNTNPNSPFGQLAAAGTAAGTAPLAVALNADGTVRFAAPVFPNYADVRVATGDVTGDGVEDLIAASGPGGPPLVTVYDGASGQPLNAFFALDPRFTLGLNVAAGDVDGDGRADVVVGTATGAAFVAAFDGLTGQMTRSFFAFPGFAGGVTVAAGDVDGDGRADVIAGAASSASAVAVFSGATGAPIRSFFAFGTAPVGVNVGFANGDVLTGTASGPPVVATYTSAGQLRQLFLAAPAATSGGARVAGAGDQILVGVGPALVWSDRLTAGPIRAQFAFDGVFVG